MVENLVQLLNQPQQHRVEGNRMVNEYGPPQVGDVVEMMGYTFMVRDVDYGRFENWVLIASGRTDSGTWVARDRCSVVYRYDLRGRQDA